MKLKILRIDGGAIAQVERFGLKLVQDTYSDEKEIGFNISRNTTDGIEGQFLEKKTRRILVVAANGETSHVEVPSINIIPFGLYAKYKLLVVYDLSGSITAFISRLGSLSNYQITAEALDVSIDTWIKYFQHAGYDLKATEFTAAHVPIEDGLEATVRLRGNVDISAMTSGHFLDKKGDLISAVLQCSSENRDILFTWKNTGSYEIDTIHADDFTTSILEYLSTSIRSLNDQS